jgi:hypothetical protein
LVAENRVLESGNPRAIRQYSFIRRSLLAKKEIRFFAKIGFFGVLVAENRVLESGNPRAIRQCSFIRRSLLAKKSDFWEKSDFLVVKLSRGG